MILSTFKTALHHATIKLSWPICLAVALAGLSSSARADRAVRVQAAVWSHGELYDVIATDTAFASPPPQSLDTIYNFAASGLTGQRSVSDAAPGDKQYNGGRWTVQLVVFTDEGLMVHDPDGDGVANFELTSEEQVLTHAALGHLVIVDPGVYFECPLQPRR